MKIRVYLNNKKAPVIEEVTVLTSTYIQVKYPDWNAVLIMNEGDKK